MKIDMIVNSKFSDHNLMISEVNIDNVIDDSENMRNFCKTNIPLYDLNCDTDLDTALEWISNKNLEEIKMVCLK